MNALPLLKKVIAAADSLYAYNETHLYLAGRGATSQLPGCTNSQCPIYQFNNSLVGSKGFAKLVASTVEKLLLTQNGDVYMWYVQLLKTNIY